MPRKDMAKMVAKVTRDSKKKVAEAEARKHRYQTEEKQVGDTRYRTDPDYREKHLARAKRAYERKKKLKLELQAKAGYDKNNHLRFQKNLCPTCKRPMPRTPLPYDMIVLDKHTGRRYRVTMYPIGMLAGRLGKQSRTILTWVKDGVLPDAMYKNRIGHRYWTQDQVETILHVASQYDLRPPVSFHKSGFVKQLLDAMTQLKPLGIDVRKYTAKDEKGLWSRPTTLAAAEEGGGGVQSGEGQQEEIAATG